MDDVSQLVEHWMREFEREPDEGLESAADDSPQLPVKSSGLLTTFTDSIGGSISLSETHGRLQHRGTVAVRGCVPIDAACQQVGVSAHVAHAFAFVASWFGYPFDAVNLRAPGTEVLSWGFWGVHGTELAGSLHHWKRDAPETFERYLHAFGIDVLDGSVLRVQLGQRDLQGRGAEWAIASEPALLAALARTGREPAAQKAQVEFVLTNWIAPVMSQPWDLAGGRDAPTVDVLKSAKHVAALLYLVRRHGRRAASRLVQRVNARHQPQDDGDAWLEALVRSLKIMHRDNDASEVLRISSSPELTAA
jgi:hypothetical protein